MTDFEPHPRAALEYWFWKFNTPDLAFLVDFIVRREAGTADTRLSLWRRGVGRVVHLPSGDWSTRSRDAVVIAQAELRPGGSQGSVPDIEWDLAWDGGEQVVTPLRGIAARLEALDLAISIRPDCLFNGHVTVDGERLDVTNVPGTFSHYWGRRLPDRWIWLSATVFEGDPSARVEAIVNRTQLWGILPVPVPIGFLWTRAGGRDDLVVSPHNGLVRVRRSEAGFRLDARHLRGQRHRIVANWGAVPGNDLGEGIVQTLHGDCTLDGVPAAAGTVGVEMRAWESLSGLPPGVPTSREPGVGPP